MLSTRPLIEHEHKPVAEDDERSVSYGDGWGAPLLVGAIVLGGVGG